LEIPIFGVCVIEQVEKWWTLVTVTTASITDETREILVKCNENLEVKFKLNDFAEISALSVAIAILGRQWFRSLNTVKRIPNIIVGAV